MAKRAPNFADLTEIALADIRPFKGKAEMVCGPITTGGSGNCVINLLIFNHAIDVLQYAGRPIFSQMPFEAGLADLEHDWRLKNPGGKYCSPILEDFYARLLLPTYFKRLWFLPDWKSSTGATWEHDHAKRNRIEIRHLSKNWMFDLKLPKDLD
jgi:hypothetical protein